MKKMLWLLVIFILVIAIASFGQAANGNVIIYFNEYKISFSLIFFIAGWLLSIIVILLLLKIIKETWYLPTSIAKLFNQYKQLKIDRMLNHTVNSYLAGNYLKSSKTAVRLTKLNNTPERQHIFLLLAIDSAIRFNNVALTNKLVNEITESTNPVISCAEKLIKAKAATLNQQYLHAITLLKEVLLIDSKNIAAYQLLLENYIYSNDTESAKECIKWLQKRKVMPLYRNEFYQRFGVIN